MKNCKYCGSELEDGQSVCPGCGREWAPEETAVPEETLPAGEAAAEEAAASQEPVREEIPAAEEKMVCQYDIYDCYGNSHTGNLYASMDVYGWRKNKCTGISVTCINR